MTFVALAARMRCSQCGKKVAEVVAVGGRDRVECRRIRVDCESIR